MAGLAEFRKKYPQYDAISDDALAEALYNKFYSGVPKEQYYEKLGLKPPAEDIGLLDMTGRAVMRGAKQLGSTFGDVIPAMVGSAFGADEYAKRQMQEAAETQKEIKEKYAPRYESYRDVQGVGDVLPYLLEAGAEQVPNIASVLLPGGIAGAGGRALAGRMGLEAATARAAEKGLEGEAAKKFIERAAAQKVGEATGQKIGEAAGVYLGSYALNAPEVFQNIYDKTGQFEPGAAAVASSVSAALDSFLPAHILSKMTPGMKAGVVERILEKSGMKPGLARGAVAGVLESVGIEAPTEAAQEAISIAAEKFVDANADVWNSKDFQRVVDAGIAGAAGSLLFGGASGAVHGYMQKKAAAPTPAEQPPTVKNAYTEADQHDLDLEEKAERAAIQGEAAAPAVTPTPAEDKFAEEAFPSMETLQARYNELEKERKTLLKQGQDEQTQSRLEEIESLQEQIAGEQDQMENRLQERMAVGRPQAAMGEEQMGLGLGEPVAPSERTALLPTTSAEAPQIGLDLGAPVETEQRGAPKIEAVSPAEKLVTDVSAAPLERFFSAIKPSSPIDAEQVKQKNALLGKEGKGGIVQAIRDMYEDLKVDNEDLPYYTGLIKQFFGSYFKPVSPEVAPAFENFDRMSAEEQKDFLKRYTNLPDLTTYEGINRLKLEFNDFVSEQQLKSFGVTPGTNAYSQAKKSLASLKSKAANTPNKLDKAERAAHDYFRRFDFDTALRSAAFDMAYGTPRNELFSGQGAETAPFFQEWLLTNAPESVNKKFEQYRRAYEHRATRDAQIDQIREEKNLTAEETAKTEAEYERGARRDKTTAAEELFEPETVPLATPQFQRGFDFRNIFGTSEEVSGSLNQMLHPAVEESIRKNDLNGALRNLRAIMNLTPYQRQLIERLLSLNLTTSIGFDQAEKLFGSQYGTDKPTAREIADFGQSLANIGITNYGRALRNAASDPSATALYRLRNIHAILQDILANVPEGNKPGQLSKNKAAELREIAKFVQHDFDVAFNSHGAYFPDEDGITLSYRTGNTVYVFLHETVHAATTNVINDPDRYSPRQQRAVEELKKLYDFAKTTSGVDKYGFTDLNEFVAEAFTNHEFQKLLQGIQYKNNASKSLWDKFVEFCMKMFGYDNVLGQTMIYGNAVMGLPSGAEFATYRPQAAKGYYENNSNEQPGAIRSISNQIRNAQSFDQIKFILSELWSSMKDQTRKYYLGVFTLRQLEEMMSIQYDKDTGKFEKYVPGVKSLINLVEDMQDSRNKIMQKGKPIADELMKLYADNKKTSDFLTTLIQTSTVEGFDPSVPNPTIPKNKTKANIAKKLISDWDALGKMKDGARAQDMYVKMRDFYRDTLSNYKRIYATREYNRFLGSKEALERGIEEYVSKNLASYLKMDPSKPELEVRGMLEAELLKEAQQLVASGKESNETALARVVANKKMERQFENMIDPYFPLKRFGRFWYKEGSGDSMRFFTFESALARDYALKKDREKNPAGNFSSGNDMRSMVSSMLQNARLQEDIKDIIKNIDANTPEEQKNKILDELGELFVTTMPSQSIRNMLLHRKNVPGASADMVRTFAHSMFHLAYQQARFEYGPQILTSFHAAEGQLSLDVNEPISEEQDKTRRVLSDYLREIEKRVGNVLTPTEQHPVTTFLSNLSFLTYLTAPASAIVNMLAVPTIGYPVLAGPYGWNQSRDALGKYMKMLSGSGWRDELGNFDAPSIGRNSKLTAVEKKAYQAFIDSGLIDISMTHDIAGLAEQPSNEYTGRWHRVMAFAAWPFHKAERFNREVMAMAAFDLAYKSNGGNFEDAVEKAKNLTYKSMFDYSTVNKPRYFQGDIAKILLQFKQYAEHMTYLLFRTAYESTKDIGKKEYDRLMAEGNVEEANKVAELAKQMRQDARRTFTGLMGMSFLFAGTMGMPIWFIFSGIANAFAAVFGDDDDEYDVENWYKNWLNSVFGGFVGDSIARGVIPQIAGVSLSDRMSTNLTDMWWRDTKRNQDEVSAFENTIINLLGPTVGMGVNAAEAVKRFHDGHTERALEAVLPSAAKNLLVGFRLANEGALTMKGDTLLDDISAKEAFVQMLGFPPERLAQKQAANIEAKSMEESLKSRRQDLLNFIAMAYDAGDTDAVSDLIEKIAAWNEVHPEKSLRISPETIRNSMLKRAKERAQANMLGGVRVNKAFASRAEEMTRYAEDEDEE